MSKYEDMIGAITDSLYAEQDSGVGSNAKARRLNPNTGMDDSPMKPTCALLRASIQGKHAKDAHLLNPIEICKIFTDLFNSDSELKEAARAWLYLDKQINLRKSDRALHRYFHEYRLRYMLFDVYPELEAVPSRLEIFEKAINQEYPEHVKNLEKQFLFLLDCRIDGVRSNKAKFALNRDSVLQLNVGDFWECIFKIHNITTIGQLYSIINFTSADKPFDLELMHDVFKVNKYDTEILSNAIRRYESGAN